MRTLLLIFIIFSSSVQAQCLKADILFVLDWSGSEDSNRVYIPMAAYDFAKNLNVGPSTVRVGVIPFNSAPIPQRCLVPSGDKELVEKLLLSMITMWPNGSTNISSSMALASVYFEASKRERGEDVPRFLFLISDGNEEIIYRAQTLALADRMKADGTHIWCISTPNAFGLYNGMERRHLMDISSGPREGYYVEQYYAHIQEELMRLELCP